MPNAAAKPTGLPGQKSGGGIASQLENSRLAQLRGTGNVPTPEPNATPLPNPSARLEQDRLMMQSAQDNDTDDDDDEDHNEDEDEDEDEDNNPDDNEFQEKRQKGEDAPDFDQKDIAFIASSLGWRLRLWMIALSQFWFFLPLLPVMAHKLSVDKPLGTKIRAIASAIRSSKPTGNAALDGAMAIVSKSPHAKLILAAARFANLLLLAEWIPILLLTAFVAIIYLAIIVIIVLIAQCLSSPIECMVTGFSGIISSIF